LRVIRGGGRLYDLLIQTQIPFFEKPKIDDI
jgi:hypothetical protein